MTVDEMFPHRSSADVGADISVPEIVERLTGNTEALCRELLPHGRRDGPEWRCGSVQGEPGKSLSVHLNGARAGAWKDCVTGQSGDLLDLVKACLGLDTANAIGWAKSWLWINDEMGVPAPRPRSICKSDRHDEDTAKRTEMALTICHDSRAAPQTPVESCLTDRVTVIEAKKVFKKDVGTDIEAKAPVFSEDAIALRFTELHGDDLRYVAPWGRWLIWDGRRWAFDNTKEIRDQVRTICRDAASRADTAQTRIASFKTIAAVEKLAQSDRRHAATTEQWDRNPWRLNTPCGTVDLRTGNLRKHAPEDFITKSTAVGPAIGCPLWHEFLRRITDGDDALMQFLKRMAGYSLTGVTREHALFFLHGIGANGKSVYLNTLAGIAGDYHVVAPTEVFMAARNDRHPTELAMLRAARLVTAIETEEGCRWAESRIKALTGGDPITGRFMRQDFFEFTPVFKLMIAGNHRPSLRNVDEAIRRRFFLVPFDVVIPADERDQTLPDRLRDEWPGILEWAIEGCLEWQEDGLAPPQRVLAATDEYLASEDAFGTWLEEAVEQLHGAYETSADLYQWWSAWAEKAGEFVGTQKRLSQALLERGFEAKRQAGTGRAGFANIRLRRPDDSDREG